MDPLAVRMWPVGRVFETPDLEGIFVSKMDQEGIFVSKMDQEGNFVSKHKVMVIS